MICTRCQRQPGEPRRQHAERVLCDDCAALPPLVDYQHPPDPQLLAEPPGTSVAYVSSVAGQAVAQPPARTWPAPIDDAARCGFIGDVLACIEPNTEADPHAILVQFLVAFGNVIGRSAGFRAEADFHSTSLYALVVGETSKGRKGTSLGYIRRLIATADSDYVQNRIEGGLSSGEGLVYAVRDATSKLVPPDKRKSRDDDDPGDDEWTEELTDPGVDDKRLLVLESEFAQVLKVMARPGNTLSPAMRNLWDHGAAGALTKHDRAKCTDAHVSIIGHIVRDELRREMAGTELANGFANRFLFVCAKRSKMLPEGGNLNDGHLSMLAFELADIVKTARHLSNEPLKRDGEARELWREVYPQLSEGRPGLLGAVTARAEAIVMRLAVIYAALDGSAEIRVGHLRAALAVWRYCSDSAAYIFGDAIGDPEADEILAALRTRPSGMTRTEIRDLFGRHRSSTRIEQALAALAGAGVAVMNVEQTSGRPIERWRAASCDQSDISDQRGPA